MPTASPAVCPQPNTYEERRAPRFSARVTRLTAIAIALPLVASFVAASPVPVAGRGSPRDCSRWNSLTEPPPTIRVLRRKSGRVEVVNFRRYVITVMGKEWPSYLPLPVVAAGAVAVKQYAWYHTIYTSRASDGRCFDVKDGTGDQLYKPNRSRIRPDHYVALAMTWNVTLRKQGRFLMTGYRRGGKHRCGKDATGYKLFAKSAVRCAEQGWTWQQILRRYYGPGVELVSGRGGGVQNQPSLSPATANPVGAPGLANTALAVNAAVVVTEAAPPISGVAATADRLLERRSAAPAATRRGWWLRDWTRQGAPPPVI